MQPTNMHLRGKFTIPLAAILIVLIFIVALLHRSKTNIIPLENPAHDSHQITLATGHPAPESRVTQSQQSVCCIDNEILASKDRSFYIDQYEGMLRVMLMGRGCTNSPGKLRTAAEILVDIVEKKSALDLLYSTVTKDNNDTISIKIPAHADAGLALRREYFARLAESLDADSVDMIDGYAGSYIDAHLHGFGTMDVVITVKRDAINPKYFDFRYEAVANRGILDDGTFAQDQSSKQSGNFTLTPSTPLPLVYRFIGPIMVREFQE